MRKIGVFVALAVVTAMLAAACGAKGTATDKTSGGSTKDGLTFEAVPGTGTGPAPSTVRIGYAGGYSLNFLPAIMAQGLGYYDEVATRFKTAIKVDIYGNGTEAEPAFLGGQDQFMVIANISWIPALLQGKDQFGIMSFNSGLGITMMAAKKYRRSKGTNLKKFDGVTWCQTGPVGTAHTAIAFALQSSGLTIDDQNVVSVGGVSAFTPALQAGRCGVVSEDVASAATQQLRGIGYLLRNYNDPKVSEQVAGSLIGMPFTTSKSFAKKYPKLTQAIVDATLRGMRFLWKNADNPAAIYAKFPADGKKQYPPEVFRQAWSYLSTSYEARQNSGLVSDQAATDTIGLLKATNGIEASTVVHPSALWTNHFVLQAYKDLSISPTAGAPTGPATLSPQVGKTTVDFSKLMSGS